MFNLAGTGYIYDGSFEGLLCCVFESFEKKETPPEIRRDETSLLPLRRIETDDAKARRVLKSIPVKICPEALDTVKTGYLSNEEGKELATINFLRAGFKYGAKIIDMLANPDVMNLVTMARHVMLERRKFVQFIRFSDFNGALIAQIEPQHNVLPLLGGHFKERYPCEQFMIYDKTHGMALICFNGRLSIIPAEDYELPQASEEERAYRRLWRMFYDTIEIKERHNERCRMNFMPKKYWKNMTEFMKD